MDLFNSNKNKETNKTEDNKEKGGLGGLFSQKPQTPTINEDAIFKEFNTISRKTRINEERIIGIRKKSQMIEHNMLSNQKKIINEIRFINDEMSSLKRELNDFKSKIISFSRELGESAKKQDLLVLERYINLWEPVNFVTKNEIDKIIEEKLQKRL